MFNEQTMYAVGLISIWIWSRFKIDQVGKAALKYLRERNPELDILEANRFSIRLVSYVAEMKNYKAQLIKDKMSTQPVIIFWLLLTVMISILSVLLFLYVQIFHLGT
jgi:hypothetical protein